MGIDNKDGGKIHILYVDDEPNNLRAFHALLRRDYRISTASCAEEGLDILESTKDIRIIFCDQLMPYQTGIDFFELVKRKFRMPIRILLTAYEEGNMLAEAINRSHIFRYVKKPWQEAELRAAIEEGNKYYETSSALLESNAKLIEANKQLDIFASSVTHDLREPLAGISLALDYFSRDGTDEELKKNVVGLLSESIDGLHRYIDAMQEYYRIRQGSLRVSKIDLNGILREIIQIYKLNAQHQYVNFEVSNQVSTPFYSDRMLLYTIINNLVSNAFKYQREEERNKYIRLDIKQQQDGIAIQVKDNGIGIPHEERDKLFELFYQVELKKTAAGGLGLFNVKQATDKLQGSLSISDLPDRTPGISIEVYIPTAPNPTANNS